MRKYYRFLAAPVPPKMEEVFFPSDAPLASEQLDAILFIFYISECIIGRFPVSINVATS
jgi:hypothetical protein